MQKGIKKKNPKFHYTDKKHDEHFNVLPLNKYEIKI